MFKPDYMFAIELKWYNNLLQFFEEQNTKLQVDSELRTIGPIDNHVLLKSPCKYIGNHPLLKSKVKAGADFVLVTEQFWGILAKSFGGGPALRF